MSGFRILAALIAFGGAAVAGAAPESFTEDFSTHAYHDTLNTTAAWDTIAGEIRLPPLPRSVGDLDLSSQISALAVDGDLLYLADEGSSDLLVLDIGDPTAPVQIGSVYVHDDAYCVTANGNIVAVGILLDGVQMIDVTDPTNPVKVGDFEILEPVNAVAFAGDVLYAGLEFSGLQPIDVSDPTDPQDLGGLSLPGAVEAIVVDGDRAYLANGVAGLTILDITDPTGMPILSSTALVTSALDLVVAGRFAYVVVESVGLMSLDVTDPSAPVLLSTLQLSGNPRDIALAGNRIYVADAASRLHVVDATDPADLVFLHTLDTLEPNHDIVLHGPHAFLATESGIQVIERAQEFRESSGALALEGDAQDVAMTGNVAYIALDSAGLKLVDISDPMQPFLIGPADTLGYGARRVEVRGRHAFVLTTNQLLVIDIADAQNPFIAGSLPLSQPENLCIAGDALYVASLGSDGLVIVDISDPTNPFQLTNLPVDGLGFDDVDVAGDIAYVVDPFHVHAVDITDPANPLHISFVAVTTGAKAIAVAGDVAYLAHQSGFITCDISDPTGMVQMDFHSMAGTGLSVHLDGDFAYVGNMNLPPVIIDISDPANVFYDGFVPSLTGGRAVAAAGNLAVSVHGIDGLRIARMFQSDFDAIQNDVRSQSIDTGSAVVVRARRQTQQTDAITWIFSANGGSSWHGLDFGGDWAPCQPGNDLRWRAELILSDGEIGPSCTELTLEWLNEFARIDAVEDIPGDQGGHVRVSWSRSGYDFFDTLGEPKIVEYSLYRRFDETAPPLRVVGDRNMPGWDFVTTVPADAEDSYSVVVPTLADSSEMAGFSWSAFLVRARVEPGHFYDSPPDSGYSVDNLAPAPPFNLRYEGEDLLAWDEAPEADFAYHSIYGSDDDILDADDVLLGHSVEPSFDLSGNDFAFYHTTTHDHVGNEGEPATVAAEGTAAGSLPARLGLAPGHPNPFRAGTTLGFALPGDRNVELEIFDVSGRRVRRLAASSFEAGEHRLVWDGRDDAGRSVPAGVYLARLRAGAEIRTQRLLRLR